MPAERIVKFLEKVKMSKLVKDEQLDREVNYAITLIKERRIFNTE